ncbi:RNA polymerase II transcription factor B subunit 2 [Purpureocillium lavendulum]|uniref:RNA polymerase II transcription factor B subunit 2 n=1 Tax=Purpureocillium lavendulum TaxID=1247861 RepID=A0AB34FN62_9HYPO|nr:RNA polymerase II transcription factor B subunit 2 [Purpureocillium lavendulum]
MTVVAIAGGLGDMGSLITQALRDTGKYEVPEGSLERTSLVTGKQYLPFIKTDYSSESCLADQLARHGVNVVICAFSLHYESAAEAQVRLIRAADQTPSVRRFLPSEFNVDYDLGDDVLPYPDKKLHLAARRALEATTTLEYAYIYPGMFMDYFGLPRVESHLRELCFFIDPVGGKAVLPDDGEARMSMAFTTDVARYVALALELPKWSRVLTIVASTISLNELVRLAETSLGRTLNVEHQPVEKLLKHDCIDLPTNVDIARRFPKRFPQGLDQLRALIADLEAGVALGAYDLEKLEGHLDLVKAFEGRVHPPKRIEDMMAEAWKA